MKGTRRWFKKRRAREVRYLRVGGYVRQWQLERWRKLRQQQERIEREAHAEWIVPWDRAAGGERP